MSLIGRIFIVLNLGMAAAFLGWASNALYTTDDFKAKYEDEVAAREAEKQQLEDEIEQLQSDLRTAEDALRTKTEQVNTSTQQAESFKTQLEEAKREADELGSQLQTISDTLGDYNDTIAQMTGSKDDAVQRAIEAETERDDAVEAQQAAELAQRDAEEASAALQQQIIDMQVAMNNLEGEYDSLGTQMQMMIEYTGVSPELLINQPLIEGAVLAARYDLEPGLISLNVGSANEVKRGFTFEIWNGGTYKGQVRVIDVDENVCTAVVINTRDGVTISRGDRAATRI